MKKTNLLISLACALILVGTVAAPVLAVEESVNASVTINEYINATVTVTGGTIGFGTLNPGDTNVPEINQSDSTGAVTIDVAAETNAVCKVGLKGEGDFSDGGTNSFALDNATWNTDNVTPGTAMDTTYAQIGSDTTPGVAWSQGVWHWINIPAGQAAATYQTNFDYKIDKTL